MRVETALVVDDSKVVQFKLRRMLEARGLEVDVASSGQESLDYLKLDLPDVIFMDSMMPDLDGFAVTGMITAKPETSAIPVIICTGNDTPEAREQARASGARGFVTKPIDDATLDALLVQLRQGVAAIAPVAAPAPPRAATGLSPGDIAPIVERVAREVVDRLVREAGEALSAESAQASRRVAQAASAAAERATREALDSARAKIEEASRDVLESAETALEEASRRILDSARADLRESGLSEAKSLVQSAATPPAAAPDRPARASRIASTVLVPWLAAVTLGVLYLLARSFF